MKTYLDKFDDCLQHEPTFCSASCPLNLDVSAFVSRLQEGRFNAAYKTYRDAAGFPFIAAELCPSPCKETCLRNAVAKIGGGDNAAGDPIDLLMLERACLTYTKKTEPTNYNLPKKSKSVAIIGAGISGMACALRLATKRYSVTVYEKTTITGGCINSIIDPDLIQKDFNLQMQYLDYEIRFNREVTDLKEISSEVDAIYVATGMGGSRFGLKDSLCELIDETGVFLGGSLLGKDPMDALADGLRMATAIENFMMTKNLKYPEPITTSIAIDEKAMIESRSQLPNGGSPSEDEAISEAKRCMKCQCNSCQLHCDLTEYVHKWPLRLRDEILATTAPGTSELHATPAVRLINSCTHCGLCKETCPSDIDMDGLIQAARFRMHSLGRMPWPFNDFFLRDMAFTNSDEAYICAGPAGEIESCEYAFFPGCQLGAGAPDIVIDTYIYLRKKLPSTGIMLGCCGIPATWAGDMTLHNEVLSRIKAHWKMLGKPQMILACPTCMKVFKEHLPEIQTVFLYDVLSSLGVDTILDSSEIYSVFDPCATSAGDSVRSSVRQLLQSMNVNLEPLPTQEKWTACCSYGGHGQIADPAFTKHVRENRISESDRPYITYCINCQDAFMAEGKKATHLLNMIFGHEPIQYTYSARRENRISLKSRLERLLATGESAPAEFDPADGAGIVKAFDITLEIPAAVRKKISNEYILEMEAAETVAFCEKTGRTLYKSDTDTLTGYHKIGNMTYWVEYRTKEEDIFQLINAYSHRMAIEIEMIWNGEKVEIRE